MPVVYQYTGTAILSMVDADGVARTHKPTDYQLVEIDAKTKSELALPITAGAGTTWLDFDVDGSWVLV